MKLVGSETAVANIARDEMQELRRETYAPNTHILVTEKNKKDKNETLERAHLSLEEVVEGVVCGLTLGHEQIVSEEEPDLSVRASSSAPCPPKLTNTRRHRVTCDEFE